MFWCKQTDPFENKVKCEECKLYTDKSDAQKVKRLSRGVLEWSEYTFYYCKNHKVPYDEVIINSNGIYPVYFFKRMEVDEDGTPFGYKKLKV